MAKSTIFSISLALALAWVPHAALAQDTPGPTAAMPDQAELGEREQRTSRVDIVPYIEASQVITAQLQPGSDVLTYTQLAAGVDAAVAGRNSNASASLRYEREIGYGNAADSDTISGIARASVGLVRRGITLEAGGLASRTRLESNGFSSIGAIGGNNDATSQIYSVYAGPTIQTRSGPLEISGAYRLGYTRVETSDVAIAAPGGQQVDIFDDSVTHNANIRFGVAPYTVAPVGLGIGGGWNRQDISNLDQRIDDRYVRADVIYPVSPNVALVGGVGYEDVEVSSRDALRDANGAPVIGNDGRLVTDESEPRRIAYETDGLIWDVGVMWRPSIRTSLEAHVGRRYGSTTYYGSLSYVPSVNSSVNVSVYDNITGFGGQLTDALDMLGSDFQAARNPISGDLGGCVIGAEGNNCALAQLNSLRSSVFRNRGIAASYSVSGRRTSFGVGAGYDRRSFIGGQDTVLASVDGVIDESYYIAANASRQLDRKSGLSAGAYISWFNGGSGTLGDGMGYSASLAYNRDIWRGLTGVAAIGIDGVSRDNLPDFTAASALLGLRYTFD
ncbi:preprotein translocase subunit YajC [Aurantiacibacter rhizosphaerae]|uniref:Preprotein translocase subunit YajC n=1 Tax=Aurantiacibacter rhizosphaerae TaxID=2691582 RepID=A0A844XDP5_9SPHN|nr:preprotein translocase subunit YajC [Aurantiacibacter rhizosphaerae]MWV27869.1 preprotein translocase subunit YajC [Aurantiacibacter rhizosphaerae]